MTAATITMASPSIRQWPQCARVSLAGRKSAHRAEKPSSLAGTVAPPPARASPRTWRSVHVTSTSVPSGRPASCATRPIRHHLLDHRTFARLKRHPHAERMRHRGFKPIPCCSMCSATIAVMGDRSLRAVRNRSHPSLMRQRSCGDHGATAISLAVILSAIGALNGWTRRRPKSAARYRSAGFRSCPICAARPVVTETAPKICNLKDAADWRLPFQLSRPNVMPEQGEAQPLVNVPRNARAHSIPSLAAMGECCNASESDKPGHLRDRKMAAEIARDEIRTELFENFAVLNSSASPHLRAQKKKVRPCAEATSLKFASPCGKSGVMTFSITFRNELELVRRCASVCSQYSSRISLR